MVHIHFSQLLLRTALGSPDFSKESLGNLLPCKSEILSFRLCFNFRMRVNPAVLSLYFRLLCGDKFHKLELRQFSQRARLLHSLKEINIGSSSQIPHLVSSKMQLLNICDPYYYIWLDLLQFSYLCPNCYCILMQTQELIHSVRK